MISLESEQTEAGTFAWFALRVRSNYEHVAAMHLRSRGVEEFSPTYKAESQWSDRKKQIDRSVFPGYVFCRVDPENRLPVLSVPGVVNLVAFGKGPEPIPDHEIESVRRLVGSGLLIGPFPFLTAGQRVLIERGPLTGVEGILQEVKKTYRLVVSITLLQRSVSAEIDRAWVRPIGPSIRPRATSSEILPARAC